MRKLKSDVHQIGMGPKFTPDEARRLAEVLARRIIGNLDYVVRNRLKDDIEFVSFYDNRQLPLYRKWAWEETKRRMVEVGILAEATGLSLPRLRACRFRFVRASRTSVGAIRRQWLVPRPDIA